MSGHPDHVRMPRGYLWLFRLGCPLLGFGLALVVKPLTRWMIETLDSAPGPLRLAAGIPTSWAIPVLVVIGIGAGCWLSHEAERDSLAVTVRPDGVIAAQRDTERYIQRSRIGAVFTDPEELVVLTPAGREILRSSATDLSKTQLTEAFRHHDYPWWGTRDPHEEHYRNWMDGDPDLDEGIHALLRTRQEALRSDNRAETERVHTQLQDEGIAVRDRGKKQQYRRISDHDTTTP
ncbi:YqeB family protein [Actinopolyspora saharensis]|uniref:PH domain-containing protein n=1 Tax=Actinopolyspora saharensis TaxID=995062 RepID=A0A1H0ZPC6_9ACTN|nr:hypothetical protein [Actinopolyspora saharensis]SDQ29217.1 hypothetical protein SAMN04489718_1161 [Actinopolyspora saharensis]